MADATVENFLGIYPPVMQEIALALGSVIKDTVPDVLERVYPGWKLIGYRQGAMKKSKYFAYVAPYVDHVRLGFEYGAWMRDPERKLEGSGSQVRYITFKTLQEVHPATLVPWIKQAAYLASLPKSELLLS